MPGADRLRQVGLFTDVAPEVFTALCADVDEVRLEAGEVLFEEGDMGDRAYVVIEGSLEILKASEGRDVVLAVHGPGQVVGEMALLREAPRMATVKAREAALLVAIPKATFDDLLSSSSASARAVFSGLVARMDDTAEQLRHNERMAQLGTLTAGIAHELNNPAAAVQRSASSLAGRLDTLTALLLEPAPDEGRARAVVWAAVTEAAPGRAATASLGALDRSDLEDEIADLLDAFGAADGWRLAPALVDAGLDVERLERLLDRLARAPVEAAERDDDGAPGPSLDPAVLDDALAFAVAASDVQALVRGIDDAAGRLSHIVRALKGYAYLDRAPVQNVDIIDGLESTLTLLAHKLGDITVQRDYPQTSPTVTGIGGDLNQVWTNLIDNAADALAGDAKDETGETAHADVRPTLTLAVTASDDEVVVEISDNGPGIPESIQRKIFDAFFTTKPPGSGTGLGLSTTHRIVVQEHHGTLSCESRPGRTTFTVRLPRDGKALGKAVASAPPATSMHPPGEGPAD